MSRLIVQRANGVLLVVLGMILLMMGGATWDQVLRAHHARLWSQHADDVISTVKDLDLTLRAAETGQRGYLLTGRDDYLAPYVAALGRVPVIQGALQHLTENDVVEQARLRALAPLVRRKLAELGQTVQLRRHEGLAPALAVVQTDVGRVTMTQIENSLSAMTGSEESLLRQRLLTATRRGHRVRMLMLGGIAIALCGLFWAARMLNQAWWHSSRLEAQHRADVVKLRACLSSLSQGVAVFSPDRLLENWNDCFHVLLGLPPKLLRVGTRYAVLEAQAATCGVQILETEAQIEQDPLRSGEPVVHERVRRDGHELELCRSPMPDGGFVLTVTNMTRRAQYEAAMREAQKMQAVGQLTGGIAHDFNNLLTVILGNLEMIHNRMSDDQLAQTRLQRATGAAQRGAALTAQLLAFARKQPLAPAPIDLAVAIPEILPRLRRTLGAGIEIDFQAVPGVWQAMADPAQLESALMNLALNAHDAMADGGRLVIRIENAVLGEAYARARHEVVPGEYVMLIVSDSGHGMTPEILQRAFEPFFTTKADGKASGLGLAMVFGFVRQSGGHVRIESQVGEGARVQIYLPRITVDGASPAQPAARSVPRGRGLVLVVEDEPTVREISVAMLEDLGYRVLEAADGEAGLRMFGSHMAAIDLVLTDLVMPGQINGSDLAERVLTARPDMKVLYMSGYSDHAMLQQGRLGDDVPILRKPFKRDELASRMAEMLGNRPAGPDALVNAAGATDHDWRFVRN